MRRILLTIEYDGTGYAGWQRQINGLAVQQVIEDMLSDVCGHRVIVTGASRTDAGVHARGQRCHFDTDCTIPADKFPFVLNNRLPADIRILDGQDVPPDFHARFMTAGKTYTYRIWNSRHGTAIYRNNHTHIPVPLDVKRMREALPFLLGTHDFAAFQASGGTARTTVRTIHSVELQQDGPEIVLTISGNAFLYNMVRIIAGTLIGIGQHKLPTEALGTALDTLNRLDLGITAPPEGLELTEVRYAPQAFVSPADIRWHEEEKC